MEFPIKGHDSCPECGCEEDLIIQTINALKDEKVVSEKFEAKGLALLKTLFDQKDLPQLIQSTLVGNPKVPVLAIRLCVCAECKHIYLQSLDLEWQEIVVQRIQGQQPPGFKGVPPRTPFSSS